MDGRPMTMRDRMEQAAIMHQADAEYYAGIAMVSLSAGYYDRACFYQRMSAMSHASAESALTAYLYWPKEDCNKS